MEKEEEEDVNEIVVKSSCQICSAKLVEWCDGIRNEN